MYWTYLRRELAGRKKQTIIVAAGLALAIALVIVVNSLSSGVRDAQAQALESVYGVGTDLTVTGAVAEPGQGGGPRFEFDQDGGQTAEDGTTSLDQSVLTTDFLRGTLDAGTVDAVAGVEGVAAVSGALSLTNSTFSGELPQLPTQDGEGGGFPGGGGQGGGPGGGFGGGSFDIDSFSVLGVDIDALSVGPLSSVVLDDGEGLTGSDEGASVAVLDATYASTAELAVGDTINVGGTDMEIVGVISSTSSADTAADVYIPLGVAQELAGNGDVVSTVYVQADSADSIAAVQAAIQDELPDAEVSSQSDLASTVSGSLSSASSLITNLGTWLSVLVLGVALVLAVLFTISGVARRTREFGTLKAIGWSNGRVVGQVAGESMVQGLIGGAVGLVVGLAGILVVNMISPTISAAPDASGLGQGSPGGQGFPGGGQGGPGGFGGRQFITDTADIVLNAPITISVVVAAVGIAVLGGLVAGVFGGWRAARLAPAEALRSVS